MLDSFYLAFIDEFEKIAGKPLVPFNEWRKHFKETGKKRIGDPSVPKGLETNTMPKPGSNKIETIMGKKATIVKKVPPTPSTGYSMGWYGDPRPAMKV